MDCTKIAKEITQHLYDQFDLDGLLDPLDKKDIEDYLQIKVKEIAEEANPGPNYG
jgi:hypothetical protein